MRNQLRMMLAAALAAVIGFGNVGCQAIECGQGTIERDGTCVLADSQPGAANCGPGTVLGPMGCEVEEPTQCDPSSTTEMFDDQTGITTCVGTTGTGCAAELPCAAPMSGRATLCGRIWDVQTDQPIAPAADADGTRCDPANPTADGPCSLQLTFYDALDFAQQQTNADPLIPLGDEGRPYWDDCGRYRGVDLPQATFDFIGIAVDDAEGNPDNHKLTGVATSNAFASPGRNFRAYITDNATNTLWSTGAGLTPTFAERGVLAIIFHYRGMPREGVTVRRTGNPTPNDDDFYFNDTGIARTMVDTTDDVTGPNGTALVIDSPSPVFHDGVGAEPAGCVWPENLAASIPGVFFVQIKNAETAGGAPCP